MKIKLFVSIYRERYIYIYICIYIYLFLFWNILKQFKKQRRLPGNAIEQNQTKHIMENNQQIMEISLKTKCRNLKTMFPCKRDALFAKPAGFEKIPEDI